MCSPSPGKRRMDTDVIKLIESQHQVTLISGLNEFMVKFPGPRETPYEGGVWNIRVDLPDKYPFKSPSIGFMNRIFHPNIDEMSGTVCLDVINQTWTPMYDLANIFDSFLPQLLAYPNPVDPLNGDAAALYLHKPEDYKKRVREYIQRFATADMADGLSAAINGQTSSNNQTNDLNNSNQTNKNESDDEVLSDFSEDEAADMDLE
jgi:ubiquitin-conjugating enzyme E2 H